MRASPIERGQRVYSRREQELFRVFPGAAARIYGQGRVRNVRHGFTLFTRLTVFHTLYFAHVCLLLLAHILKATLRPIATIVSAGTRFAIGGPKTFMTTRCNLRGILRFRHYKLKRLRLGCAVLIAGRSKSACRQESCMVHGASNRSCMVRAWSTVRPSARVVHGA